MYPISFDNRARPNAVDEMNSFIRILHASPDAPAVDVYANGSKIASNLKFKEFTEYLPVMPGSYNIKVFPAGTKRNPVINTTLNVPANKIFTIAAINKLENIMLMPILDPKLPISPGMTYVRFGHLSPNAPAVDVRLENGMQLFSNVPYMNVTPYKAVMPGTYNFEIYPTGSNQRVLYVPNANLGANRFYTLYAVGLVGERPPLQVLIPLDGNSYIEF